MYVFIALTALAVLVAIVGVALYNSLVARRNRVANSWSQIDVQLKRRHDLIPGLVNSVKGYMAHERAVLEHLSEARARALTAGDNVATRSEAEGTLSQALRSVFALAESYPDLKADRTMLSFQEELASTENKIAFARQAYNDAVMEFNTACQSFPGNLVAGIGRFETAAFFEGIEAGERQVPKVEF